MAVSYWSPVVGSSTGGFFAGGSSLTFSGTTLTIPDPTISGILTTEVILTSNASITLPTPSGPGGQQKNPEVLFIQGPGGPWTPAFLGQAVEWPSSFNISTGWSASVGHYDRVQFLGRNSGGGYGSHIKGLNYTPSTLWSPVGNGAASVCSSASFTLPYTALAVGDVIGLGIANFSTKTVSGVSSAGAGSVNWTLLTPQETDGINSVALAVGTVATAGSLAITAVMTGAAGGQITCQEFVPFSSTPASVDGAGFGASATATSVSITSGTPAGTGEMLLAAGYITNGNGATAWSTGYTNGPLGNPVLGAGALFWNCNIPGTAQTLTVNQAASGAAVLVGVLLKA